MGLYEILEVIMGTGWLHGLGLAGLLWRDDYNDYEDSVHRNPYIAPINQWR